MKILILLLCGVALSEQSFWFAKSPEKEVVEPTPQTTGDLGNRYIVNILKYAIENGTESPAEFACIGTLVAADYALTPADCVKVLDNYKIAVQFVINEEGTNNVGPSIVLKRTEVTIHDKYVIASNETYNIALVKFFPQGISVNPPIFEHFYPIARGALPKLSYCSVIGSKIHLANPPEEQVLVNGPGCCDTAQAFCTVFPDKSHSSCTSKHGSPVICDGIFAGFLLRKSEACVNVSGRVMMKYHSVDDFKSWIDYYIKHQDTTTTTTTETPSSATFSQLSLSVMIFVITSMAFN